MLSLLSMNKQELESAIQAFSNEVQTQFQEFQRVIEFSSKLLLCDYLFVQVFCLSRLGKPGVTSKNKLRGKRNSREKFSLYKRKNGASLTTGAQSSKRPRAWRRNYTAVMKRSNAYKNCHKVKSNRSIVCAVSKRS